MLVIFGNSSPENVPCKTFSQSLLKNFMSEPFSESFEENFSTASFPEVCEEWFSTEPFWKCLKWGFARNLLDGMFCTKPFSSFVKKVCCETFDTELFLLIHDIGFFRNHLCGTFFMIFHKWFRRKPPISRNQKRFRECIEVKNLFKFRKKPFFFRMYDKPVSKTM